jgi:TonB family protein
MRNKFFFVLVLVLSFGLPNVSAQPPTPPKTISGGVLNGKATSLPKPSYPSAAVAVNASGAVNVQVTVDENGDVISASAVSGHPLLRQACEQAARTAKFAPTLLQGQLVKITGVIVYNFVLAMTFTQIGYELSLAEKTQLLNKYQLNSIGEKFPQSWREEKEAVKKLDSLLVSKSAKEEIPLKIAPVNSNAPAEGRGVEEDIKGSVAGNVLSTNAPENRGVKGNILTLQGGFAGIITDEKYTLDDNSMAVIRELQSKLKSRLGVNENIIWSYRLGIILGKLKAEIDSNGKTRANVSELNQLNANKPPGISEAVASKLKELIESSEQTATAVERTEKLLPLIENLRNVRGF